MNSVVYSVQFSNVKICSNSRGAAPRCGAYGHVTTRWWLCPSNTLGQVLRQNWSSHSANSVKLSLSWPKLLHLHWTPAPIYKPNRVKFMEIARMNVFPWLISCIIYMHLSNSAHTACRRVLLRVSYTMLCLSVIGYSLKYLCVILYIICHLPDVVSVGSIILLVRLYYDTIWYVRWIHIIIVTRIQGCRFYQEEQSVEVWRFQVLILLLRCLRYTVDLQKY